MQIPVIPLQYGTKIPIKNCNWRDEKSLTSLEKIDCKVYGVATVLGKPSGIVAVDLDDDVDGLHSKIIKIAGDTPVIKKGEKGQTRFYRYNGERKKQFNKEGKCVMDLLGDGSYTVLPPSIHPNTRKPYVYIGSRTLQEINQTDLPFLPTDFQEQVERLIGGKNPKAEVTNLDENIKSELKDVLSYVSPNTYEDWVNVGMALKGTHGDDAFELWDHWSSSGDTYKPEEMKVKWDSFTRQGLTTATIYKLAIEKGYQPDDTLFTVTRAKKQLQRWKESGYPVGDFTGIKDMQNSDRVVWHLRKKEFTVITGKPNSGKSEFLDYLVYNCAVKNKFKTFYVSFEKSPVKHIESHIHRFAGKPMEERTEEDNEKAEQFVNKHFYFYNHAFNSNKIEDIFNTIKNLTKKIDIDIIVIDPFSYLESDYGSAEHNMDHVKRVCILLSKFAKMLNVHIFLVAHPKSFDDKEKWDREQKKYVPAPMSLYSISGGATFYNKCDNGIIVARADKDTEVKFVKIREQEFDKTGSFLLTYDRQTRRFDDYKTEF